MAITLGKLSFKTLFIGRNISISFISSSASSLPDEIDFIEQSDSEDNCLPRK